MGDKIFIIDDNPSLFFEIKKWFVDLGFREDRIIPSTLEDIKEMVIASKSTEDIIRFVEKQIRMNYEDLDLILCDIRFRNDNEKGYKIVEHIRRLKNFTPSNWAKLVPIFGMTFFADSETTLNDMIKAGADYAFNKVIITQNQIENQKMLRAIIESQIRKFQMNLESFYPPRLKDEIITFKIENKSRKSAFIMSDFLHLQMAKDVQKVLFDNGICGYFSNASGERNDEEMWKNIQILLHACDFGICIYSDDSRPNSEGNIRDKMNARVSFEVGYMFGLQKEVCFLKQDSLTRLHSDFNGEKDFAFSDEESLEIVLIEWLRNRGFIEENDLKS